MEANASMVLILSTMSFKKQQPELFILILAPAAQSPLHIEKEK